MKKGKRLICLALAACLLLCLPAAAGAAGRSCKVTVSGGLYGLVNGAERSEKEYAEGESFRPGDFAVTVTNEKYCFIGFYISGQERPFGAQPITQDIELVARYALKAETARITVRYRTAAGTALHDDDVIRVKLGQRVVVHARHVGGYAPDAYSRRLIPTGENEVTFIYAPLPARQTARRTAAAQSGPSVRPQRAERK